MSTVAKSTQNYSGFDPRTLGGCTMWLDANDSNTFTFNSGTNVSTWTDKASNVTFTQGGTASLLTRTTYEGYPTVFFNSTSGNANSNTFMSGSVGLPLVVTIIQVITPLAYTTGTFSFLWSWNTGPSSGRVLGLRSSNAAPDLQPYITWVGNVNRIPITNGTRYINFIEYTRTTGSTSYSINGETTLTTATLAAANFVPTQFNLGGDGPTNPTSFGRFYLSEMIMYSNRLNAPQRQAVEGYLSWKWGLSGSFSIRHPYRQFPPFTRPFQPIDLSGCSMWLDAADRSTFTFSSDSNISVWSNKSSRVDSIGIWDAGAGQVRLPNGNLGNSVPTVRFSNFAYSSNILGYSGNNPETIFIVGNNNSTSVFSGVTRWSTTGGNDGGASQGWAGSHLLNVRSDTVRAELQGVNGINISSLASRTKLAVGVVTATTLSVFESGTPGVNPITITLNQRNANIRIGTSPSVVFEVGEIIYYNRELTTEERQYVEGYLAQKWGLAANLPTTHPFYLSRVIPSTPQFFPPFLSNCTLWIDAADTGTITFSNSNVVSINDKSLTAYNLTRSYTSGFEITYANRLNGLPTLLFPNDPVNNNNTRTFLTSATNFTINTSLHACFFVMRFNPYVLQGTSTARGWGQIFPFNMNATNGFQCGLNRTTSNWTATYSLQGVGISASNTTVVSSSSNGPAAPGLPVIGAIVRTGSTAYLISYNGILQTITGASTLAAATATVRVGIYFQNQELCELIFYNGIAMTLDDIRKMEGYLAWKWGLQTTLPVSHPYYEFRP